MWCWRCGLWTLEVFTAREHGGGGGGGGEEGGMNEVDAGARLRGVWDIGLHEGIGGP